MASEGAFAVGSLVVVSQHLPARLTVSWATACAVLVGSAFVVFGPAPCLVAAAAASITARLAQMRSIVRARTAAGVAAATWLVLAASNATWALTAALHGDRFFASSAAAGAVASLTVVATCVAVARWQV